MNKKQLDEISRMCRKHKISWLAGKGAEGYTIRIDLSFTTNNYPLLVSLFREYEKQNPVNNDAGLVYKRLMLLERKEKIRRGTSRGWGDRVAGENEEE